LKKHLNEIKELLDENYFKFNRKDFIEKDPVSIPHSFKKKEDMEIAGLMAATIAWGNRKAILRNANRMVELMDGSPHDFIVNHSKAELKRMKGFVHRTFNEKDLVFFITSLRNIYRNHGGLENAFQLNEMEKKDLLNTGNSLQQRISHFRNIFLETAHENRSEKHLSDPLKNSASKRICMYLRWMVRKDNQGVDLGIWKSISPSELCLPLDVHTGNVSRALGLLKRKQDDWKAVIEITEVLRQLDKKDPVKYDFALFGMGVENLI